MIKNQNRKTGTLLVMYGLRIIIFFQVNINLHTLIIYANGRDNFAVRGKRSL